ncbi:MAG: lysine methyltransferase, partial [Pseudomonas sp.]
MNTQAVPRRPARDTEGIYPFAGLPVRLGFPSKNDFEVIHDVQGIAVAVIARREFPRISRMCRVSGQLLPYRCRQTRQLQPGIHIYDPRFFGLFGHSCNPNEFLDLSELWLWALRDIYPGEALTMDYAATEDKLIKQFACDCGSSRCHGWITGYDE